MLCITSANNGKQGCCPTENHASVQKLDDEWKRRRPKHVKTWVHQCYCPQAGFHEPRYRHGKVIKAGHRGTHRTIQHDDLPQPTKNGVVSNTFVKLVDTPTKYKDRSS